MTLEQARERTAQALEGAHCPAVLWSGGKDSSLLLQLARETRPNIIALWLRAGQPETQVLALIHELQLTVYSFPATDRFLLTNGTEHSVVTEYDIEGQCLPVVLDIVEGATTCLLEQPQPQPFRALLPFDVLLWGAREADEHWLKGDNRMREDGWQLGRARVYAPLRHMTNEQLQAALFTMSVKYVDANDLPVCAQCMTSEAEEVWCPELGDRLRTAQWDKEFAVRMFRKRHGLHDKLIAS